MSEDTHRVSFHLNYLQSRLGRDLMIESNHFCDYRRGHYIRLHLCLYNRPHLSKSNQQIMDNHRMDLPLPRTQTFDPCTHHYQNHMDLDLGCMHFQHIHQANSQVSSQLSDYQPNYHLNRHHRYLSIE